MRIGIDGSCWANRRGFGRFTRNLVTAMAKQSTDPLVLLIDQPSINDTTFPEGLSVLGVHVSQPPSRAASAAGSRRALDLARMSFAARKSRCDAFFFPASYTYYPVPWTPTVVTIHDAIAERMPGLVFPGRAARLRWAMKQRLAVRRAAAVVTVSAAAGEEVGRWLRVPSDRLHVVNEAPDPVFGPTSPAERTSVLARYGLGPADPYVLYVGGISPHKNLVVLVEAFERVVAQVPSARLLLVGDVDDDPFLSSTASVRSRLAVSPAGDRVRLTGFVPDHDLAALYGGAVASVLPSLGEGFGLTAAESAACGTPVVASDIPALRELLGDTAMFAPRSDAGAFANVMCQLLTDASLRERLSESTLRRAAGWSWDAAAATVLDLLASASGADMTASR